MQHQPRRVVTGIAAHGISAITEIRDVEPVRIAAAPTIDFFQIWGTGDGIPVVGGGDEAVAISAPFFPGPGGTRFLLARYGPASSDAVAYDEAATAEANEKLPGLMDVFPDPSNPMHATSTIDYAICVSGEIFLELDSGDEILLTPGTCVVQLASNHAWHNRSSAPCVMCFFSVGADRRSVTE